MGIAGKLKKERRALRGDLKEIAEAPVFYFATEQGGIVFRGQSVSGRMVNVTYAFTSHGEAKTRADEYTAEWGEQVHVRTMPVGTFLSFLFHHLGQADIDIILTDGEKPLPLTTMGVNVIQDPLWAEYLEKSRKDPSKNVLLAKVARDLMASCGGPLALQVVASAEYGDLIRSITGQKRAILPTVDLGLVWFLTRQVFTKDEDGNDIGTVEPIMLKITGKDDHELHQEIESLGDSALDPEESIIVGPLAFTSRQAAFDWAKVLPPHIAIHLMGTNLMLSAEQTVEFLGQIPSQFPAYRVDDMAPDGFVFDGGVLPLTERGAAYVESKINYKDFGFDETPERNWLTIAQGKFLEISEEGPSEEEGAPINHGEMMCREMALRQVAQIMGVTIVTPESETPDESCILDPHSDDELVEAAIGQFMREGQRDG